MCVNRTARVVVAGTDRYNRTLGRIWCGGLDTSAEQVRRGMAWVYDKYVTDRSLYAVQQKAQSVGQGLWTDPAPVPPWMSRNGIRQVNRDGTPMQNPAISSGLIIGNRNSRIYHLPKGCPSYTRVSPRNRVPFQSEETARAALYRIARNCR